MSAEYPFQGGPSIRRDLADEGTYHQAECGCECWNQGGQDGVFILNPCRPDCPSVRYVHEASVKAGKPIEYRGKV